MTAVNQGYSRRFGWTTCLAAVLLCVGIARVFSLVLHDPLLGYANNYDMTRIQACHQIWPADPAILPATSTPDAPLRYYTRDRQVDEPCFASSELVFTAPAIWLAERWNHHTGENRISLQALGLFKAGVLCLTALLASLLFFRQGCYRCLLAHALVFLLVLADPGVTLYLNTFYSEFSAVYGLYLSLLGVVMLALARYRPVGVTGFASGLLAPGLLAQALLALGLLALGLVVLGLSKPQHMPLALVLAGLTTCWLFWRGVWTGVWRWVPAVLLAASLPVVLYASGTLQVRDATMAQVNRTNLLGALLGTLPGTAQAETLTALAMPASCLPLAGSNWHQLRHAGSDACMEAGRLEYRRVLALFVRHPGYLVDMVSHAVPRTQRWVMGFYGQVEGQAKGLVMQYHWSVFALFKPLQATGYSLFFCVPLIVALALGCYHLATRTPLTDIGFVLPGMALLQWCVLGVAVTGDGFVDIAKHSHLAIVLLLAQWTVMPFILSQTRSPCVQ